MTPQQRRNYYYIILSVISMQITASTIYMVFPLFFSSVGLNKGESGLLISIGTFAGILSSIAAGILSNRYGRKKILFIGTLLYTVVFFIFIYAGSGFGVLMVLRFIEGIGFYVMPVMVTTMAADIFPPGERGKAMGLFSSAGGVGSLIGPLISPLLITGNNYTVYFLFTGGFVAVSAIAMFLFVKETLSKEKMRGRQCQAHEDRCAGLPQVRLGPRRRRRHLPHRRPRLQDWAHDDRPLPQPLLQG